MQKSGFKILILLYLYECTSICLISAESNVLLFNKYRPIITKTSSKFLSVALDASVIQNGFKNFNLSNPKLIKMISHLSPAYLRVGGTMADRLIFVANAENSKLPSNSEDKGVDCVNEYCSYVKVQNFSMYGKDWLLLNNLTKRANLEMVFDLNVLIRSSNDSWDSRNAEDLINFSNNHGLNINWQLGNEPNSFRHTFNYEVNASQLAADFQKLKRILGKYKRYANSLVIGPDTTRPQMDRNESMLYLEKFLKNSKDGVDIISWHQYYFDGRTATESNFLDPIIFDILDWQIDMIHHIQMRTNTTNKKVWLGETSSAWGGGSPQFSDKFLASFIWLDKLGIAAKKGLDVVVRQSIFHGNYALISKDLEPNPDYWISILYKHFVGNKVMDCFNATANKVRLYCHCTAENSYKHGISLITVYGMNMQNETAKIRIIGFGKDFKTSLKIISFTVSSKGSLLSTDVYLNDVLLRLKSNNELPNFRPKIVEAKPYAFIPPFSIVFWIIPTKSWICY